MDQNLLLMNDVTDRLRKGVKPEAGQEYIKKVFVTPEDMEAVKKHIESVIGWDEDEE